MKLGIFTRTWSGMDLDEIFNQMEIFNLHLTQFKMTCVGQPTIPSRHDESAIKKIEDACKNHNVDIVAISGTFNLVDPNKRRLHENIKNFKILCEIAQRLNVPIITLCTGTKDEENMWKFHPDNNSKEVWSEMSHHLEKLLKYAQKYNIILGIEPETSNVINSAIKAKKLLCHIQSDYLKIIMDGANLFHPGQKAQIKDILEEAFCLLGNDIALVHAKDLAYNEGISYVAAGKGVLDYKTYICLLKKYKYKGPLIMHGLSPDQISDSIKFLKENINAIFKETGN